MNILVVHGPNLNLLGESKSDPVSYDQLNARIEAFARELGAQVKIVQSNHEGDLLDAIQAARRSCDAILINPAALTHTSYALRECLRLVGKPAIEVHLEDIRRRETWRRRSVIKDVCEAQVMGKGLLSYLDGLERLVTGRYNGLRKGRAAAEAQRVATPPAAAEKSDKPKIKKTLGRAGAAEVATAEPAQLLAQAAAAAGAPEKVSKTLGRATAGAARSAAICRSAVRERISMLLARRLSAAAVATWARDQWMNVERGAATEMGQRELLSETLQTLALSATPAGKLSDGELVELMTRLD